ncbi:orotidine-5'-phosphate decarboxylase [uncultured Bifidobacterium sp.]|uniref:orotidine-5'-phosphate decarboxylase n=1 Tax=uncultured Bifidobacterium sp. TaxID=165187 RepID=UPI0026096F4B|nr:orotidine-5'-phosphate decarboxylase [uncultured Bifidobacterium sp.]
MDRLIDAIEAVGNPSVVGLDPTPQVVPPSLVDALEPEVAQEIDAADLPAERLAVAYMEFNRSIIDAVVGIVAAVKPQIAMYEALGPAGMDAYTVTCEYAASRGLYVIGDIKRGDIGSTAVSYAAHLSGLDSGDRNGNRDLWHEDAVTVNPYLGSDGILPFVSAARDHDKDAFVLVRTSNPSSDEVQECLLDDGLHVYEHVADLTEQWGEGTIGAHGYSRLGAVVGATQAKEAAGLRGRMPHTFFLVPGYGAQGGTSADIVPMFDSHGSGAIVNSSRGIIGAWRRDDAIDPTMGVEEILDVVSRSARKAAIAMRDDITSALAA